MSPSHPGLAESVSLEEAHRAAGVTDFSKGSDNGRLKTD